jgi:hypothetical protein
MTLRVLTIILILIAGGRVARAADPAPPEAQAEALMRQGVELRRSGQKVEALDLFRKAQAIAPSAQALAQIGSVEFALRRWVDAETHLEQSLATRGSPWIENPKNRDMLERTLADARRQIGQLDLRGTSGAQVSVDGQPVRALPLSAPVHVAAGRVRVTATAPGHAPFDKTIEVAGGQQSIIAVDLVPLPAVPATPAPAVVSAVPSTGEQSRGQAWRKWTGGSLFVVGLAAVGAGIAWVAVDGHTNCSAPPGGWCDSVYNTKTQGWIAIGAGAVAVGAGATLFLWKGRESTTAVGIAPGSLTLRTAF